MPRKVTFQLVLWKPASYTMKLLITLWHNGRGSCPYFRFFDEKRFKSWWPDNESIWNDNEELLRLVESDNCIALTTIEVEPDDKWLILFDGNSDAGRDGKVGILKRGENIDEFVKTNYMQNRIVNEDSDEEDSGEDSCKIEWNYTIPEGPLDWTGKNVYSCIANHYSSELWGWADGHADDEPNLIDITDGATGYGIFRFDLDHLQEHLKDDDESRRCVRRIRRALQLSDEEDEN